MIAVFKGLHLIDTSLTECISYNGFRGFNGRLSLRGLMAIIAEINIADEMIKLSKLAKIATHSVYCLPSYIAINPIQGRVLN